jgi:hypothetical protein
LARHPLTTGSGRDLVGSVVTRRGGFEGRGSADQTRRSCGVDRSLIERRAQAGITRHFQLQLFRATT